MDSISSRITHSIIVYMIAAITLHTKERNTVFVHVFEWRQIQTCSVQIVREASISLLWSRTLIAAIAGCPQPCQKALAQHLAQPAIWFQGQGNWTIWAIFFCTSAKLWPYPALMTWFLICFSWLRLLIYHPDQEKQGSPFPSLYFNKILASFNFRSAAPAQSCMCSFQALQKKACLC